MTIDSTHLTILQSLAGGVLIGLAVCILLLFCGRIAGISGITGSLLNPAVKKKGWMLAFIFGMLLSPVLYSLFSPLPDGSIRASWGMLITAGLLVGIGTRLGSGCTSGHGVCGIARLSVRSLVATLLFLVAGMLTVWLKGLPV